MELRVRKPDGWTTVSFPDDVEQVSIATGKTDGRLSLPLVGARNSMPNEVVTGVLDVDREDEGKIASEVSRTNDGTSLPLDQLRPG